MEKQKILVVDDDKHIAELISLYMMKEGYETREIYDGKEAAAAVEGFQPDLILLDLMLPGMDGYQVCTEVRKTSRVPIIMLTAKGETFDKVLGLELGADDYIVKPFSNMELLMRVKAILRRSSGVKAPVVTEKIPFADLILDTESRSVSRQGEMIPLTYTEFRILELFVTHKKKIYSLENIYQSIWGEDAVGDSAIMVHIKNIRKKLGDDSRNPKYIKTAWGRGYYVDQ
mgnify:CR=1 FL=1